VLNAFFKRTIPRLKVASFGQTKVEGKVKGSRPAFLQPPITPMSVTAVSRFPPEAEITLERRADGSLANYQAA